MRKRRIERTALATLSLAACVVLFGAFATVGQAQAQGKAAGGHGPGAIRGLSGPSPTLEGVPSTPGPTFNPSIPYTVPQSPETPVSPGSPGSVFGPR
jgi:hypothetical protein